MITTYDVIRYFEDREKAEPGQGKEYYDPETKMIIHRPSGMFLCSVADFARKLRLQEHSDFSCIYSDHVQLTSVLQCNECGTVIFARDDEDDDPNLVCPNCTSYQTNFTFWTKEEIEGDPDKARHVEFYRNMREYDIEHDKRVESRGGLMDYELFHFPLIRIFGKQIKLELHVDSVINKFPLKGLSLYISIAKKEKHRDASGCYIRQKSFLVPLSISAIREKVIYLRDIRRSQKEERVA
jgi:DNA-directed RNA polymerase subunit M/transcription elongation factor TFIIS